jgi:hypothetical protein
MDFRQLNRGELIAVLGGAILGISLFLKWYTLADKFTTLGSCKGPDTTCSAWHSLMILRILLLITAVAHRQGACPLVAARGADRDHRDLRARVHAVSRAGRQARIAPG